MSQILSALWQISVMVVFGWALLFALAKSYGKRKQKIEDAIRPHLAQLLLERTRGGYQDKYGHWNFDAWFREADGFFTSVVSGTVGSAHKTQYYKELNRMLDIYEAQLNKQPLSAVSDVASGLDFEIHVASLIESVGLSVRRIGGSGDQGVDLIAVSSTMIYAVQCKWHSAPIGNSAVQQVKAGEKFHSCEASVVVGKSGFTPSARKLAAALGVDLVDLENVAAYFKSALEEDKEAAYNAKLLRRGDKVINHGTIKWHNEEKKYGFIVCRGEQKELFYSSPSFIPKAGDHVVFEVDFDDDGLAFALCLQIDVAVH